MIRNFIIRNNRLAETFDLYVLTVIFSNRDRRVDDIRDCHHDCFDFFFYFFFSCRQFINFCTGSCNFFLHFFCFFFFTLCHQCTDLFTDFVFICTQGFYFLLNISVFLIQSDNFVHHRQLPILKFIPDILLYHFRIFSSWNFLRIFSLTTSGFSRTNLISNIFSSLFQVTILVLYYNK